MESNYIILFDKNGQPYLAHHGIKGQKWGVRRFQNPDMTWTEAGKERYGTSSGEHKSKDKKSGMSDETKKKLKTAAKVAGVAVGTAALAYGAYKGGAALNKLAINRIQTDAVAKAQRWFDQANKTEIMSANWSNTGAESDKLRNRAEVFRKTGEEYIKYAGSGNYSTRDKVKALKSML